ncbi:hypothetical protein FACS1894142_3820 [Spirochaetia bacterium]|nr:hypothetical protein FACS1894142_3820 [Spirochaetia bacterium]
MKRSIRLVCSLPVICTLCVTLKLLTDHFILGVLLEPVNVISHYIIVAGLGFGFELYMVFVKKYLGKHIQAALKRKTAFTKWVLIPCFFAFLIGFPLDLASSIIIMFIVGHFAFINIVFLIIFPVSGVIAGIAFNIFGNIIIRKFYNSKLFI